jgi:hypothetical protein
VPPAQPLGASRQDPLSAPLVLRTRSPTRSHWSSPWPAPPTQSPRRGYSIPPRQFERPNPADWFRRAPRRRAYPCERPQSPAAWRTLTGGWSDLAEPGSPGRQGGGRALAAIDRGGNRSAARTLDHPNRSKRALAGTPNLCRRGPRLRPPVLGQPCDASQLGAQRTWDIIQGNMQRHRLMMPPHPVLAQLCPPASRAGRRWGGQCRRPQLSGAGEAERDHERHPPPCAGQCRQ